MRLTYVIHVEPDTHKKHYFLPATFLPTTAAVVLILISVLSAIGICERCRVQSGGVYFLIAHVLGSRRGAAVGIIYVLGQVRKGERTPQSLQILHLQLSSLNS